MQRWLGEQVWRLEDTRFSECMDLDQLLHLEPLTHLLEQRAHSAR
jgi:hypothetical protein